MNIILAGVATLLFSLDIDENQIDSVKHVNLEEVAVYAVKTKESEENSAGSISVFPIAAIEKNQLEAPKSLTLLVPNLYMPAYGSKLTSAVYIRGVGSRMNDPAVGLYVDNIPYLDKSVYDFDFLDIATISLLRGPQGTLYGRNAMAGVMTIRTISPLSFQGVRASAGYGSRNSFFTNVAGYFKVGENTGMAIGGFYNQTDGFFDNSYDGAAADGLKSGGVRLRLDSYISDQWQLGVTLNGEKSKQEGYPYAALDKAGEIGEIDYNDEMGYERQFLIGGMNWKHSGRGYTLLSTTSWQYFDDEMKLDQDFTSQDIFTLRQQQRQSAWSQEFVGKSASEKNYQWLWGAFGFYKLLKNETPVLFKKGGVEMIQDALDAARGQNPYMPEITIVSDMNSNDAAEQIETASRFRNPSQGFAFFHQSVYDNFFFPGFSVTAGIRFDYEKTTLEYLSGALAYARVSLPPMMGGQTVWQAMDVRYEGEMSSEYTEWLPKVALNYRFSFGDYNLYLSASKGYTVGGHNIQLFSDLVSSKFQQSTQEVESPEELKEMISYQPEYNWSYELGGQFRFWDQRIALAASLFYIDSKNQQITQMVDSGLGRIMKNAGHSESYGVELSGRGSLDNTSLQVNYGYTHATFSDYKDLKVGEYGVIEPVDYKGKFVPLAPRHTLSANAEHRFDFHEGWIDHLFLGVQYRGAGKVFFDEANTQVQDFYSLLNANITFTRKNLSINCWFNNITDARYKLFSFKGLEDTSWFAQQGKPFHCGVTLKAVW